MNKEDISRWQDLIMTTATEVGIKVLAAVAFWVIGRWLIGGAESKRAGVSLSSPGVAGPAREGQDAGQDEGAGAGIGNEARILHQGVERVERQDLRAV